ncbi:glycosyltransferase family 58 protein [Pholiota conissans]|uniref:Dol-P-Man:Man(5)GlcNAc(2)-PP-Dol alpha-1,3-mannosyltransferase n=1 Tax=Pholiota conissans TaxID=109636 RepID=A0A9P5YX12_9AGAR|nr:glycosyltransferase family 58 protein [Pholiota conissans]
MSTPSSSLFQNAHKVLKALLFDSNYFWHLASLVLVGDTLLTGLIIRYVPYTEIDWETYMIQTKVFLQGQHNYSLITGPTGPLVYPAGHVQIHKMLYNITDAGANIRLAQTLYGLLYLTTLALSCGIYYSAGHVPNWIVLLLPLSKRLHSIFVLRLFNDCWCVAAVQAAILAFQNGFYDTGMLLFSAALSVKMGTILYLPGLLVILFKKRGLNRTIIHIITLLATQALFAVPFLREDPWAYIRCAFDLSRVFLYEWTVNWRIFDERTFLSSRLATTLLTGHATVLVAFGLYHWCKPDGGVLKVLSRGLRRPSLPAGVVPVTADYVATVLFTSNLIGIIFARSLHYQFYSWYAQQIPFLAWRTRFSMPVKLALIVGIEYAWNVFPSTPLSSGILLTCNVLLTAGVWFGYSNGKRS